MCNTIIHGIPVESDPSLSTEEINKLVCEVIQSWTWEGRKLGKVEIIRDGQWIWFAKSFNPGPGKAENWEKSRLYVMDNGCRSTLMNNLLSNLSP
ncbi:MAG: hypothetical protein H6Q69_4364 [Firmicutes bacterium]|nr:hypothetical protein [Bacillota bacterium]